MDKNVVGKGAEARLPRGLHATDGQDFQIGRVLGCIVGVKNRFWLVDMIWASFPGFEFFFFFDKLYYKVQYIRKTVNKCYCNAHLTAIYFLQTWHLFAGGHPALDL